VVTEQPVSLAVRQRVLLAAVLVGHVCLAWTVRAREIFTFGDDAAYLLLARSLRGFSYREVQFITEPIAARFPPGYPALLAFLGTLFGERLDVIAGMGILFSVVGLIALFDVIRRRWSPELALLVTAICAVNPTLVEVAGAPVTEATFTGLLLCSLWAADWSERTSPSGRRAMLAGALAISAALVRSAGVTIPLSLGAHWLLRRRVRWVVALGLASSLTVGSWLAWTAMAPKREVRRSYVDDAIDVRTAEGSFANTLVHRIKTNVTAYGGQMVFTELKLPLNPSTVFDNVFWMVIIGGAAIVGAVSAWRRWNAVIVFSVTYGALLTVWPYNLERFLAPMLPVIIALTVIGAGIVANRIEQSARLRTGARLLVPSLGVLLTAPAILNDSSLVERAEACTRARVDCARPASLDFIDAARFAATHTPPSARFIVPKNATLYYFAQRQSVFWEEVLQQDTTSFLPYLQRQRITHILGTPIYSDYQTVFRLVLHDCDRFDVMRAYSQETMLLALRATPRTDGESGPACVAMRRALIRKPVT